MASQTVQSQDRSSAASAREATPSLGPQSNSDLNETLAEDLNLPVRGSSRTDRTVAWNFFLRSPSWDRKRPSGFTQSSKSARWTTRLNGKRMPWPIPSCGLEIPNTPASRMVLKKVLRKCAKCEEEEKEENPGKVARKASDSTSPAVPQALVSKGLQSPGRPLDARERAFFEPRFGYGLGAAQGTSRARGGRQGRGQP